MPHAAGQAGPPAPIATRLALRDLARYRARSGSALAAITLGVLIAMLVSVLSAQRFGNVLDYAANVAPISSSPTRPTAPLRERARPTAAR